MRASALSDDQVIRTINEFFIPVEINVTTDGFPSQIPAMKAVELVYNSNWRHEFGFASCLALDPDGKIVLGTSVAMDISERMDPGVNFSPKRYMEFIVLSLERFKKLQQIQRLPLHQKLAGWTQFLAEIKVDMQKSVQSMLQFQAFLQQ